jgi:putative transcriptional regulator
MAYEPIQIDHQNLTLMGVPFPDKQTLTNAANAIGSNMFEGFEPTPQGVAIIRDYILDKITFAQMIQLAKDKKYA